MPRARRAPISSCCPRPGAATTSWSRSPARRSPPCRDSRRNTTATSCARSTATDQGRRLNSSVLIDRTGKVVSVYDKIYPYWNEFDMTPPALPGQEDAGVYDADFGRIGFATCFDAKFPEVFQRLRDRGAELVVWPSAYSGFTELQAFALLHHYYIVTSTLTGDSILYDITGAIASDQRGTGGVTVARFTVDMDRTIYHYNFNLDKRARLLAEHAADVVARHGHAPRRMVRAQGATARRLGARPRARIRSRGAQGLSGLQPRRSRRSAWFLVHESIRRLPWAEGTSTPGVQAVSRAVGIRLAATLLPALVLLGAVGQNARRWHPPAHDRRALQTRQGLRGGGTAGRLHSTRRPRRSRRSRTSNTASASTGASTRNASPAASRGRSCSCRSTRSRSIERGVQDVEPLWLRRRGVDAVVPRQRTAHVRVHDQAPRRLLDVRHEDARHPVRELGR